VTETLVKDYDHRPMLQEIIQHPLFRMIPGNPSYIQAGLIMLMKWVEKEKNTKASPENEKTTDNREMINRKTQVDAEMIKMENLVNGNVYTQTKKIAEVLSKRHEAGLLYTYSGDLLLAVNPEEINISDELPQLEKDEPHMFALVNKMYNKMLQERKDQVLLACGMEKSGKQVVYKSALKLLVKLGSHERFENEHTQRKILAGNCILNLFTENVQNGLTVTVKDIKIYFNCSGSISGACFTNYFLEGITDFSANWNKLKILKMVPMGLRILGKHREFGLQHFLAEDEEGINFKEYFEEFNNFLKCLQVTGFRTDTGVNMILRVLVAIALIMKLEFDIVGENTSVHNKDIFISVANLLEVDDEFLMRALIQTNVIKQENFYQSHDPKTNAEALAFLLYTRLLDWVEDFINCNLKLTMAVYGVKNSVNIIEFPGSAENVGEIGDDFGTLLMNTTNEMVHHVLLKKFIQWEEIEAKNNRIKLRYPVIKDNKVTLDCLLSASGFLATLANAASEKETFEANELYSYAYKHFTSTPDCHLDENYLRVNHFWGQIKYRTSKMMARNENFINPELIQTLSSSSDECLRNLFQLPLDKYGKVCFEEVNTTKFSQTLAQQTIVSRFRYWLHDMMSAMLTKEIHVVMCFDGKSDLIEQVEAFNLKEITYVAKKGFPARLTFADFLRQYCFLAFNFDERVVATRENAQLLMLRLAMDGFECGRRKIFLKFYHINYLTNLYNIQYKRILIVQSAVRRYLAKKRSERQKTARLASKLIMVKTVFSKWKSHKSEVLKKFNERAQTRPITISEEIKNKAAINIQRHFRGFAVRQRLKIQIRVNVLNILKSPMPDRKEKAELLLKDEGLTVHEAKAAVDEISNAIQKNMIHAVVTNEEMVDIFLKKVFNNNIEVHTVMKNCKDSVPINSIDPIPGNFVIPKIASEELLSIQQSVYHNSRILPPMKLYNIEKFYTEKGPIEKWDNALEQITFDIGKNIVSSHGHVIKERMLEDKTSSYKTMEKKKNVYQVAKVTKLPKNSDVHGNSRTINGINVFLKKAEVVSQLGKLTTKGLPPTSQLVEQMKQLKREHDDESTDRDIDGPYDFRRLLRQTDVLPTNTLRQFRQRVKLPILKPER
jgi:myosin-3